jgi:hypothetical protein
VLRFQSGGGFKMARWISTALLSTSLVLVACKRDSPPSGFAVVSSDRQISLPSTYPLAHDPSLVGTYPPDTKSGSGYFYDEVLEYRVWFHPENGAKTLNGTNEYFFAFAQYEAAEALSKKSAGAEPPLALVRQLEWIDEPERGRFIAKKGDRITEWQVRWLARNKRKPTTIEDFMKHPWEADP